MANFILGRMGEILSTARVHRAHRSPLMNTDHQMCAVREHEGISAILTKFLMQPLPSSSAFCILPFP
jgi:hypothetical protein